MKILEIKDNKGYLLALGEEEGSNEFIAIDEINRNHLLALLEIVLSEDVAMDDPEVNAIGNQAHEIIYKNIYQKFFELKGKKEQFKDASEGLYKDALEKYSD